MKGAIDGSDGGEEKATTDIEDVGRTLASRVGLVLGTDQQNRQHCFWPARGEITVRERDGCTHVTVERFDLGAKTTEDYRLFVEKHVEDVDVDWNEEAF